MLLAIMLLHCGLFYAQDYSMTQIQSMADTYFEMGSNAVKGRSTTSVTWDTLYHGKKVTSGNSLQVNTSTLPVGTYTIIVESTTDAYQTKFIK